MTFLNPLFLVAMAAAAIPLIIHLFNFRRPKRIDFSSLAFLEELQKSTMQRVRIKQWLLLALRTLAIAALVIAFARPTMMGSFPDFVNKGKLSTAIVFDNSSSMSLRDGEGASLEQARNIAAGLVNEMNSGDELYLLPTISSLASVASLQNKESARQAVIDISIEGGKMFLSDVVRHAADLLEESANPNRELYVLSDLQQSTLGDSLAGTIPDDIRLFLLPVGGQDHDNISVSDINVLSQILSVGQVVRMDVRVENHSVRAVSNVVVSLFLEDERVAQATVDLGAGEIARVPIAVTPRASGWLAGRIEVQDSDYEADDRRAFTLLIPEVRKLLLVEGKPTDSNYLNLVLSPEMTTQNVQFDVTTVNETALSSISPGQFDTLILNGVSDLSSGEISAIVQYVEGGGGVLLFPGDTAVTSDYNALLSALNGGSFGDTMGGEDADVSVAVFDRIDAQHPLFEGMFEGFKGDTPKLEQPDIFRMMPYHPGSNNEQTLIRMSGDQVFLQELRAGAGNVLLYTVAPTLSWSDFPVRGLFVPLLFRSIYYLSATGSVSGEEFVEGSAASLRLSGMEEGDDITIRDSRDIIYKPELRRVPGGLLVSVEPGYLRAGIYDVLHDDALVRRFAVHPVDSESALSTYPPGDAAEKLEKALGVSVTLLDLSTLNTEQLGNRLQSARTGIELWNVFLMLALFSLVVEMIVEKRWRPETV